MLSIDQVQSSGCFCNFANLSAYFYTEAKLTMVTYLDRSFFHPISTPLSRLQHNNFLTYIQKINLAAVGIASQYMMECVLEY
jgi:hypothetical protein